MTRPTARALIGEALALGKDLGDKALIPCALNSLGDLAGRRGDHATARALLTEGLEVSRQSGDKRLTADLLLSFGLVAEDGATARASFAESLAIHRELGGRRESPSPSIVWAVCDSKGNYALACSTSRRGTCAEPAVRSQGRQRSCAAGLADVARLRGDHELAFSLYRRSLTTWRELGEKPEFLRPLEHLAAVSRARGQPDRAVCLWAAAHGCREVLSIPRAAADTDEYEREMRARTALGEERFAATWAQGQAMSAGQAINYALQVQSCATQ